MCVPMLVTTHVETVVLLTQQVPDSTVEVNLEMSDFESTSAETKATYEEIKAYVFAKYGIKVPNLFIAQVKKEFGIPMHENYNKGKEGHKIPKVTDEKRKVIIEALRYYQMI